MKTLGEDERYSKYFKMLKMGVPLQVRPVLTSVCPHRLLQAVKNKMAVEGLDGAVLARPDAPAPPVEGRGQGDSSAGEESDGWE